MPRKQLQRAVARFRIAQSQLEARWRQALGISAYEMLALIHLQQGPLIVSDLGKRLALTSGAMTGLVDRLVKADLLQRVADPDDGRRVLLHLAPAAQTRMSHLQRPFNDGIDELERSLTAHEAADLASLLDRIADMTLDLESRP